MTAETEIFLTRKQLLDQPGNQLTLDVLRDLVTKQGVKDGECNLPTIATLGCRYNISVLVDDRNSPVHLRVLAWEQTDHDYIRSNRLRLYDLNKENPWDGDYEMASKIINEILQN